MLVELLAQEQVIIELAVEVELALLVEMRVLLVE